MDAKGYEVLEEVQKLIFPYFGKQELGLGSYHPELYPECIRSWKNFSEKITKQTINVYFDSDNDKWEIHIVCYNWEIDSINISNCRENQNQFSSYILCLNSGLPDVVISRDVYIHHYLPANFLNWIKG